ncbi:MAG: hypothetical protein V4438_04060 [Patescibacteria group bacterium]
MQRLNNQSVAAILAAMNAIHTNSHFVGTSRKHLNAYVDKDAVGCDPLALDQLAYELAHRINGCCHLESEDVVALIGAPMGAIALGNRVTYWLNELFPRGDGIIIKSFYAQKTGEGKDDPFKLRTAFANQITDRCVIAIEDILNTGESAEKTICAILAAGGTTVVVAAICNRGNVKAENLNVRFVTSLMEVDLAAYPKDECPMCKDRVPMRTDLGHGREFIEERVKEGYIYPVAN